MPKVKSSNVLIGVFVFAFLGVLLGLVRSWLSGGLIIAGHDSGLALDAWIFLQKRFYAWDPSLNFGIDNSMFFGSLTIHGIDCLMAWLGSTKAAGNFLSLFFWLALIFLPAVFLALNLKEKLGKHFIFLFPVFVTLNFYVLQAVFIIERAKFGLMGAFMILLGLVFRVLDKKQRPLTAGLIAALYFTLFNGGSFLGLPLYGGLVIIFITALLYGLFYGHLRQMLVVIGVFCLVYLVLNAYALYPYLSRFLQQDYQVLVGVDTSTNQMAWLEFMSRGSSFFNLIRLQGVPDWYDTAGYVFDPEHAYSTEYFTNPLLIGLSLFIPFFVINAVWFAKKTQASRVIVFFGIALLLSLFLSAGTHNPTGFIYRFFYIHVPGFSIFRSPYFKFGSILYISVSALVAYLISFLAEKNRRKILVLLLLGFTYLGWTIYHYPSLSGKVLFGWNQKFSTAIKPPSYVYSFADWTKSIEEDNGRFLLLPALDAKWVGDAYEWGYWSLSPLPHLLSDINMLTNDSTLNKQESGWVAELYKNINQKNFDRANLLAQKLGVKYLLLRQDVVASNLDDDQVSQIEYTEIINDWPTVSLLKKFGPWSVYEIDHNPIFIALEPNLVGIEQSSPYLAWEYKPEISKIGLHDISKFKAQVQEEVYAYFCQSCELEKKHGLSSLPHFKVLPTSPLYFIKEKRDRQTFENIISSQDLIDAYTGIVFRRSSEVMVMIGKEADHAVIVESLNKINDLYFQPLIELLQEEDFARPDYTRIKNRLDIAHILRVEFSKYLGEDSSHAYYSPIANLLDNTQMVLEHYAFYNDPVNLFNKKIYYINLPNQSSYLHLAKAGLPVNAGGGVNAPDAVILHIGSEQQELEVIDNQNRDWISYKLDTNLSDEAAMLELHFNEFKNLLSSSTTITTQTADGKKTCLLYDAENFKGGQRYLTLLTPEHVNQKLEFHFVEDRSKKEGTYLKAEDVVELEHLITGEASQAIYHSNYHAQTLSLYLCRDGNKAPEIQDAGLYQLVSPLVLVQKDLDYKSSELPSVSHKRLSPVKYQVQVVGATDPFILNFNTRYSPYWKLSTEGNGDSSFEHVMLNQYSNGWLINEPGSYTLELFYTPQKRFYIGLLVSSLGLVLALFYLIHRWYKNK